MDSFAVMTLDTLELPVKSSGLVSEPNMVVRSQKRTKKAKAHDAQAKSGSEVTVLLSDVFELIRRRVEYLHIAREISIAISFRKLVKRFICDLSDIKLVVADGQNIILNILKDGIADLTVHWCRIREAGTIVQIAYFGLIDAGFNTEVQELEP